MAFLATGNAATAHAAGPPWADPEQTAERIDAQEHVKNKKMWDRLSDAFCDVRHVKFTDAQILKYFEIVRISPVRYRRDTVYLALLGAMSENKAWGPPRGGSTASFYQHARELMCTQPSFGRSYAGRLRQLGERNESGFRFGASTEKAMVRLYDSKVREFCDLFSAMKHPVCS